MINTVANLMFLKTTIRNAFRECKRYFVYTEIIEKMPDWIVVFL